jgi:glycosyltransferase involved in cell wall biosynthesis
LRIFFFSFDEVPSFKGASTHILAGLRQVVKEFDVTLVTLGEVALPSFGNFRHLSLSIREENYLKRALAFRKEVARIIDQEKPDLIHFRGIWEGVACVESGIPCVYEVNGLPSIELKENFRDLSGPLLLRLKQDESSCLQGARQIIVPSELIRSCLFQEYQVAHEKIQLMPNGHDRHLAPISSKDNRGILQMVYIGTLHPWQGLLWSLPHLKAFEGRLELDVYGPEHRTWMAFFKKRLRKHGLGSMVRHRGTLMRPNYHRTLSSYHLGYAPFLQTQRNVKQGAHPVKILDYLSCGVPVLASDLPLSRQLLVDRKNAILFKPQGHKELHASLEGILNQREALDGLAQGARLRAQELPDWQAYSENLGALYGRFKSERMALR